MTTSRSSLDHLVKAVMDGILEKDQVIASISMKKIHSYKTYLVPLLLESIE